MTSQMTDQSPLPDALTAPPGARRCKQPGCDSELPAAAGRGAPRLFCSPECSRKWHNDHRAAAGRQAAADPGPVAGGPLAGLHQLLTQAAGLVADAAAQLAAADPGQVTAALAAADADRRQARAETAAALARAARDAHAAEAATAAMHAARHDTQAALEAADQARADADTAEAREQATRDHAGAQITQIRQQADAARAQASAAHAEHDHVRADAARERDALTAACTAQLRAIQALADTQRARAEHAERQLDLERDHQRRLTAQPPAAATSNANPGNGAPAAKTTRPATAKTTTGSPP
jgi:hypothetical protein